MKITDKAEQILNEFKAKMMTEMEEAIGDLYSNVLPHVENDNYMNVQHRSDEIIKALMSGTFQKDDNGKGVYVADSNGVGVYLKITDYMYDTMRTNLIKAMPVCPKDMEIESLKLTIKHMQDNRSY